MDTALFALDRYSRRVGIIFAWCGKVWDESTKKDGKGTAGMDDWPI